MVKSISMSEPTTLYQGTNMKIASKKTNLTIEGVIAGHSEWTQSDKTGECAEMDWPHPGKEVIDYLEYNTVGKYSTSSINTVISKCKVKKVECIYNISSYDKPPHSISAAGQPSGVTPG